eukprot:756026-Hanusia_phi.AAC.2
MRAREVREAGGAGGAGAGGAGGAGGRGGRGGRKLTCSSRVPSRSTGWRSSRQPRSVLRQTRTREEQLPAGGGGRSPRPRCSSPSACRPSKAPKLPGL